VLAKVTRDRIMVDLDARHPEYGFAVHQGYATADHSAALTRYGPCPEHRFSYANVAAVAGRTSRRGTVGVASGVTTGQLGLVGENVGMEGGER